MINLTINTTGKTPVYKQLIQQFEAGVRNGNLKDGEQVMSMNELAASLDISKETIKKVYSILRDKGILEARQGKGFYVKVPEKGFKPSVLVIFDKLSAYKQTLFNSFAQTIHGKAEITILLHNQDVNLLEYYIDQNLGKFDYYVITPHFSLDAETQKRVLKNLMRIPNRQLIMADNWLRSVPGNYGAVYQDYEQDAIKGLTCGIRKIQKSGILHVITLENSLYGKQIEQSVKTFCETKGIQVQFYKDVTPGIITKDGIYLMLNSSLDSGLIALSRAAQEKKLKIGKDIRIISYNESPISEIVLGGLTTISTDFAQMGKMIAQMILHKKLTKVHCDFKMTKRNSF